MVIKKAVTAALALLAAVVTGSVEAAKGFSYSYADIGYLRQNLDTSNTGNNFAHEDGIEVDAAFGVYDLVSLRARFMRGRIDTSGGSANETIFSAGALVHYPVFDKLDVFGEFLWFNSKLNDSNVKSSTDLGADYSAGVRYRVMKKLELGVAYRRLGGNWDEGFGKVQALYRVTKKMDVVGKAELGSDDDERYFAGIRLNF